MSVATSQQPCQGLEIASWCREHYGQASFHLHAEWFNSIPPSALTGETLKPQQSQPPLGGGGIERAVGMCELIWRESFLSNINVQTYFHVAQIKLSEGFTNWRRLAGCFFFFIHGKQSKCTQSSVKTVYKHTFVVFSVVYRFFICNNTG